MFEILPPVNRAHAKYAVPSQRPLVRSASIAVLSRNFPSKFGADDPLPTTTEPRKHFPSFNVLPLSPAGLSKRATHTSPNVFGDPSGSPELSEPMNTRPCASHAMTGSPAPDVRTRASAA